MHEEYILTPKIFCGTCGSAMVGECGTSKSKNAKYYYYKCVSAKRARCKRRKGLKKNWIEELVVTATVNEVLKDDVIDRIAEAMIKLQDTEDPAIPSMLKQLSECEKSIENMLNAIQAGVLTSSTRHRLEQLEEEKNKLNLAILEAQLKLPLFSKDNIVQWISSFKNGDPKDKEYQRKVVDTFVNSVYVYDDRIVLTYNFKDGGSTLILDDIKNPFSSDLKSSTPPHKRPQYKCYQSSLVSFIYTSVLRGCYK